MQRRVRIYPPAPATLARRGSLALLALLLALGAGLGQASPALAAEGSPASKRSIPNPGAPERSKDGERLSASPRFAGLLDGVAQPSAQPDPLAAFASSVADGSTGVVRGVYVPGVLALRVVQQPAASPYFVDLTPGVATQFRMAGAHGVTGLLADNIASGTLYEGLAAGQIVSLIYGDGSQRRYQVQEVQRYQALRPQDPYTEFVHLDSGARLSSTALFSRVYTGGDQVTFQTCIARDGLMTWGRLFVIATPLP